MSRPFRTVVQVDSEKISDICGIKDGLDPNIWVVVRRVVAVECLEFNPPFWCRGLLRSFQHLSPRISRERCYT